jgi:helicase
MKMLELAQYGVPGELVELWSKKESDKLLPLQELAVKKHGLFGQENLLVQAPTSSGKTFIGEMAALHTALRRKKVIYLVPIKALAEEKYLDFRAKYEPYGIKTIISTRDHREFDRALEEGDFSLAVVVYEKLEQLLVRRPERLEEIDLVIADEVELLSDPDRGADVELLLTHILHGGSRVIALSAVLGHADKLAHWLKARLVTYDRRPSELRYGVIHEGAFRYRTYNDFQEAEEPMVDIHSESSWEILTENLSTLVDRGESSLVFVKARYESRRGAELLAQRIHQPAASDAIEALQALEATHSRDVLINTLNHGVAFHNADLSPDERHIVEEGFREGDIKVMVSTSTLAQGMNLPAHNVFITTDKWRYDRRFGLPWKTPILRGEYENMGGRAGRYNAGPDFGRSILIAPTSFDHETLWRQYVEGEREGISPRLAEVPLDDHLLRLIAGRRCRSEEELNEFMHSTLTGQWIWAETLTLDEVAFRITAALNRLHDAGLTISTGEGRLSATPFGVAVAAKGISMATARELEAWIGASEMRDWSDIDLLLAAALTSDGRLLHVALTSREYEHADYHEAIKSITQDDSLEADVPLNRLRNCTLVPFFEEVRAIKGSLFLLDWMDHRPLFDLEEEYHTMAGQILAAAEQLSWLVDATAALAQAFGCKAAFVERLEELALRVQRGLQPEAASLAQLHVPRLTRNAIIDLTANNLHTAEAIVEAPLNLLSQWVPAADAEKLQQWARTAAAEPQAAPRATPTPPCMLIVDDRRPGEITVAGRAIALQEKQYRLIRILAETPGECVPYDTIYNCVWGEVIVEPNQMHFQKRRLLNAIAQALPNDEAIIKTIPKRGFLLDLPADAVTVIQGREAVLV